MLVLGNSAASQDKQSIDAIVKHKSFKLCISRCLDPGCISRFRNVNAFHRLELQSTLVNALIRSSSTAVGLLMTPRCTNAVCALAEIAGKGDVDAIAALAARLADGQPSVKCEW